MEHSVDGSRVPHDFPEISAVSVAPVVLSVPPSGLARPPRGGLVQGSHGFKEEIRMTRRCLTVAAAAFLTVASLTVWTHEASAFTTAVRLCVQKQRRNLRNALLTARAQAQSDFQKGFRGCFDNDQ